MPKNSRPYSMRPRASPYSGDTRNAGDCRLNNLLGLIGDEKEWKEARCPICMEHPHNAVLLLCACHEKGCRPYVCNTNTRHSNCLDQFLKSPAAKPTAEHREIGGGRSNPKYLCPLCRGEFTSWAVIESARNIMNGEKRSCSLETCDFNGTYPELRNHVSRVHPTLRPSEADPERLREWTRLEEERQFEDLLIHIQDGLGEDDLLREMSVEEEGRIEDLPAMERMLVSASYTRVWNLSYVSFHIFPERIVPSDSQVQATTHPAFQERIVSSHSQVQATTPPAYEERSVSSHSQVQATTHEERIVSSHSQVQATTHPAYEERSVSSHSQVQATTHPAPPRQTNFRTARMSVRGDMAGRQLASRNGEEYHPSGNRRSYRDPRY